MSDHAREAREDDFRMPEFIDKDPKDYEFRGDGKIVRKDRFRTALFSLAGIFKLNGHGYEIDEVIDKAKELIEFAKMASINLDALPSDVRDSFTNNGIYKLFPNDEDWNVFSNHMANYDLDSI